MQVNEWQTILVQFIHNWFSLRKSMYFILIKDIYLCSEKNQIMIKYQCANKRLGDSVTLDEFMKSPLKHATHPDQMFQIGIKTEHIIAHLNAIKKPSGDKELLSRFKKIFYKSDE